MADELSLTEFSILAITNDRFHAGAEQAPIVLTTKDSYIWAAAIAWLAERAPQQQAHIDEDVLADAYRAALVMSGLALSETNAGGKDYFKQEHERFHQMRALFDLFLQHLDCPSELASEIFARADGSYRALIDKGLIEDPVFIPVGGLWVAVLGFVPYSFTFRTSKGGRVYRKIEALFWKYEQDDSNKEKATDIQFRVWKIINAFRQSLAEETDIEMKREKKPPPPEPKRRPGPDRGTR